MYDNDPADIAEIGWDNFITGVWESIFVGYQTGRGPRALCRRCSDLLQGGIGCTEELADELVRLEIVLREDRAILRRRDPVDLLAAMDEKLADMGRDLAELDEIRPDERSRLVAGHAGLRGFLRASALEDAGPEPG